MSITHTTGPMLGARRATPVPASVRRAQVDRMVHGRKDPRDAGNLRIIRTWDGQVLVDTRNFAIQDAQANRTRNGRS